MYLAPDRKNRKKNMSEKKTEKKRVAKIIPGTEWGHLEVGRMALEEINKWLGKYPDAAIDDEYIGINGYKVHLYKSVGFYGVSVLQFSVGGTQLSRIFTARVIITDEPIINSDPGDEQGCQAAAPNKPWSLADAPLLSEATKPQIIADFGDTRLVMTCDDVSGLFCDGPLKTPRYVLEGKAELRDALGEKHVYWVSIKGLEPVEQLLIEDLIKLSRGESFGNQEAGS